MTAATILTPPLSPHLKAGTPAEPTRSIPTTTMPSTPHPGQQQQQDAAHPLTQTLILYQKATSTFLLQQHASAYSTSLEALELLARTNQIFGLDHADQVSTRRSFFVLKQKLWILNVTIFGAMLSDQTHSVDQGGQLRQQQQKQQQQQQQAYGGFRKSLAGLVTGAGKESPEKLVRDLWKRVVEDYGGLEGDIDGQVMVPFVLLCINQKLYKLGRQVTEAYLATIPEGMLIHLETAAGAQTPKDMEGAKHSLMTNYERLVELYVVHVLAKLGEWDYAQQFLEFNTVLPESYKEVYAKILHKLRQKSLRPKKDSVKKSISRASSSTASSTSTSSFSTSTVSSTISSSLTSPTLAHQTLDTKNDLEGVLSSTSASGAITGTELSSSSSLTQSSAQTSITKATVVKGGASGTTATKTIATNLQARLLLMLQHYVGLIRQASAQMGPSQLMVIVGLVAFLGVLSRNRTKAAKVYKMAMAKVMQTVKMGTTVTSI